MELPEPDGQPHQIPDEMHAAIKALGNDPVHKAAVDYLIGVICGRHRLSFVAGVPNASETMAWFEGRRFVGEIVARLIERPVPPKPEPPEPRAAGDQLARARRAQQQKA